MPPRTWTELGSRPDAELFDRGAGRARDAVDPRRQHRVERVGDVDDPGAERDLLACKPVGVTRSVEALVVVPDRRDRVVQEPEPVDDPRALRRMALHEVPLNVRQGRRLQEHRVRHCELADVVEQRSMAEQVELRLREPELASDRERQVLDAARVSRRVRVPRVDRRREALHRGRRALAEKAVGLLQARVLASDRRRGLAELRRAPLGVLEVRRHRLAREQERQDEHCEAIEPDRVIRERDRPPYGSERYNSFSSQLAADSAWQGMRHRGSVRPRFAGLDEHPPNERADQRRRFAPAPCLDWPGAPDARDRARPRGGPALAPGGEGRRHDAARQDPRHARPGGARHARGQASGRNGARLRHERQDDHDRDGGRDPRPAPAPGAQSRRRQPRLGGRLDAPCRPRRRARPLRGRRGRVSRARPPARAARGLPRQPLSRPARPLRRARADRRAVARRRRGARPVDAGRRERRRSAAREPRARAGPMR